MHSVQYTPLLYEIYLSPQYAIFLYVHIYDEVVISSRRCLTFSHVCFHALDL